ncbi:hypothetical protein PMSD_14300 [Paenibacillus macquariensis subsp. defensor]|nr:hypothetical protein PMSD_14300 [Paenibacillus macquariensis subsp. defensor]
MFNRNVKKVLSSVMVLTIAMQLAIWPAPVSHAASGCSAPVADLVDFDFNESMTHDKSPRNVDGTAFGNPSLVYEPALGKNVLSLNGNGQFIMIPDSAALDITGPFTMLVQFSTSSLTGEKGLFGKTQAGGYGLEVNPNKIESWNHIGGAYRKLASPALVANKYYDAAIVYTGTQHTLYVDGKVVATEARTGAVSTNDVPLAIGTDPQSATTGQLHFTGKIGYAKMFNKGLTANELQCYYDTTGIMADHQIPTWGTGSQVTGVQIDPTNYSLNWTDATDDKGITQYRVYRNGSLVSTVAGNTTSYRFREMLPGEKGSFKIEAGDAAGNWTTDGPSFQYEIPGTLWPTSQSLTLTPMGLTSLKIEWPAAFDEQVITQYRVYLDGTLLSTHPSSEHQTTLQAIPPGTTHTIEVEAGTASGIWATVRLTRTLTMPGFDIVAPVGMNPDLLDISFEQTVIEDNSILHNDVITDQDPNLYFHPAFNKRVLDVDGSYYARIPHHEALSPMYLTLATSFMLDDLYRNQTLIGKTNHSDYTLEFNPITKKLEAWFLIRKINGQESYVIVESKDTIATQQVYYATATYDGATAKLYLNGALVGSKPITGVVAGASKVDLLIGANAAGDGAKNYMDGKIGFVHLYSKVLEAASVKDLYDRMTSVAPVTISALRWEVPQEIYVGTTEQAKIILVASDGSERVAESGISYKSLTPNIATVTENGLITPLQAGSAVLKATFEGVSANVSITVKNKIPQSLTIVGPSVVRTGEQADLSLYVNYDNGESEMLTSGNVYSSNQPSIATISPEGKLTALKEGKAIIHAESLGMNADLRVQVVSGASEIKSLKFTGPLTLYVGQKGSTVLNAVYSDNSEITITQDVRYESDNPSVASVDAVTGVIEAVQAGSAYISAIYQGYEVGYGVTVQQPKLRSVRITGTLTTIRTGDSFDLKAEALYSDDSVVDITKAANWSIANESLIKMKEPGSFTALIPGKTMITAVYNDMISNYEMTIESPSSNNDNNNGNGGNNNNGSGGNNSNNSSNGSGSSVGVTNPSTSNRIVITDADLKNKNLYPITTNTAELVFPVNASNLLGDKSFKLQGNGMQLDLPSSLFKAAVKEGSKEGLTFSWSNADVPNVELKQWMSQANMPDSVNMDVASKAHIITVSVKGGSPQSTPVQFMDPVHAVFSYKSDAKKSLLGVYQILGDGTIKYIGGKVTSNGIEADVTLNGRYIVMTYEKNYKDVNGTHWALDAIQALTAKHITEGTSEDYFEPSRNISRAEFVALLVRSLNIPLQGSQNFSDVSKDTWYATYVGAAVKAGWVNGQQGDIFAPEAPISREEMTVLLARAYSFLKGNDATVSMPKYTDATKLSAWSVSAVQQMSSIGIIKGASNGKFEPQRSATRAESVQVIMNLLNTLGGVTE